TYKMKIDLMDASFAVLSYLQDRDTPYLTRITNDGMDFQQSYKLYMKMTQTSEERASAERLEKDYTVWMQGINDLIRLRDEQYEKTDSFLKDLDKLAVLLNAKIQEETKQRHWAPSKKLQETAELEIAIQDLRKNVTIYLTDPDMPYEQRVKKDLENFESHLKTYRNLLVAPEEQETSKNLRSL